MDRVLSVTNHKGGVGKTTTAVNIAYAFAEAGNEVLLIDLDPQGSATVHLGVRDDGSGLLYAMQNAVALPVVPTGVERLALVPAGPLFMFRPAGGRSRPGFGRAPPPASRPACRAPLLWYDCRPARAGCVRRTR